MTVRLSCADGQQRWRVSAVVAARDQATALTGGAAREAVALLLLAFWPPVRSTSAGSKVGCPAGPCLSRIADHFSLVRTPFPGWAPSTGKPLGDTPQSSTREAPVSRLPWTQRHQEGTGVVRTTAAGQRCRRPVAATAGPADGPLIRSPPGQTRGVQSASRKRGSGTRRSRSDSWKSRKGSPLGSSGRARRGWDRPGRRPRRWRAAAPRRCRDVRWTTAMACAFLT
jgi:hypothetical protein